MLWTCGLMCLLLSIWGLIQLVFMALFFYMEVLAFIHEAEASVYSDYDHYLKLTKTNYRSIALNCLIAACIYLVFIGISYFCMRKAKILEERKKIGDDDIYCKAQLKKLT